MEMRQRYQRRMPGKGKKKVRVCVAQINYNSKNIQKHVERIKDIIKGYKSFDLIVFPELLLHGHPSFEKPEGFLYRKMAIMYSAISKDLYKYVQEVRARVIIGELKRWGEKYYNVATYIDNDVIQSYTKTHVHWTENFVPGKALKVFDSSFGKIGITICFDSAFSEVWRVLALKGADVIVNISAVPRAFPAEHMALRASGAAIYNQVFVVYANRPGPFFSGCSAIYNPRGGTVVKAGLRENVITGDIDLNEAQNWRTEENVYGNRRPLLYREIVDRHKPGLAAASKRKKIA